MRVSEMAAKISAEVLVKAEPEKEIKGGYITDLLSVAMAEAGADQVWVTLQGHQNIVAVAVLVELAAVVIAGGIKPDNETIEKAKKEGVNLLSTELPIFEVAGRLYTEGLRGYTNA